MRRDGTGGNISPVFGFQLRHGVEKSALGVRNILQRNPVHLVAHMRWNLARNRGHVTLFDGIRPIEYRTGPRQSADQLQ